MEKCCYHTQDAWRVRPLITDLTTQNLPRLTRDLNPGPSIKSLMLPTELPRLFLAKISVLDTWYKLPNRLDKSRDLPLNVCSLVTWPMPWVYWEHRIRRCWPNWENRLFRRVNRASTMLACCFTEEMPTHTHKLPQITSAAATLTADAFYAQQQCSSLLEREFFRDYATEMSQMSRIYPNSDGDKSIDNQYGILK